MGVYAALKRGSFTSQVFMTLSLLGVLLPTFVIGILLILVFSVTLDGFPSFGRGEVVQMGWWSSGLLTARAGTTSPLPCRHAGDFSAHAHHAAGARRNAGGAAQPTTSNLRARAVGPHHSLRPCTQEHPGAGDDDHGPAAGG